MTWGEDLRGPVRFHALRYTKGDLLKADEKEAVLFLMCNQLHNDISSMLRILLANAGPSPENEAQAKGAISIQLLMVRMIAGRLHEGWGMLTSKIAAPLREAVPAFNIEAQADRTFLGEYFAKRSLIPRLRNKVSFHNDVDVFVSGFRSVEDAFPLVDFHQQAVGNTLFHSADEFVFRAMMQVTEAPDEASALTTMNHEIVTISRRILNIAMAYAQWFCRKHLDAKLWDPQPVVVEDQPHHSAMEPTPFIYTRSQRPRSRRRGLVAGVSSRTL